MARPRKISDERLLAAAATVIGRAGPKFTLAQVADEAGVAVGTVAGRFGSRLELLHALSVDARVRVVRRIRQTAESALSAGSAVDGVRASLLDWFSWLDDPHRAANSLAALAEDLVEPTLRALLGGLFGAVEAEIKALLSAASADLPGAPPPARGARLLVSLVQGSALLWSVRPRGRLRMRLAQDIDAVLKGWT